MKILHVIRSNDDRLALQVINEMRNMQEPEQTVLFVQDGVYVKSSGLHAFACAEDVCARGVETELPLVDYDRIVDMIFEHDKVITW